MQLKSDYIVGQPAGTVAIKSKSFMYLPLLEGSCPPMLVINKGCFDLIIKTQTQIN